MGRRLILIAVLLAAGVGCGEDSHIPDWPDEATDRIEAIEARIEALEEKLKGWESGGDWGWGQSCKPCMNGLLCCTRDLVDHRAALPTEAEGGGDE